MFARAGFVCELGEGGHCSVQAVYAEKLVGDCKLQPAIQRLVNFVKCSSCMGYSAELSVVKRMILIMAG